MNEDHTTDDEMRLDRVYMAAVHARIAGKIRARGRRHEAREMRRHERRAEVCS